MVLPEVGVSNEEKDIRICGYVWKYGPLLDNKCTLA